MRIYLRRMGNSSKLAGASRKEDFSTKIKSKRKATIATLGRISTNLRCSRSRRRISSIIDYMILELSQTFSRLLISSLELLSINLGGFIQQKLRAHLNHYSMLKVSIIQKLAFQIISTLLVWCEDN